MSRKHIVRSVRIAGVAAVAGLAVLLGAQLQARAADAQLEQAFTRKVGPLEPAAYASPTVPDGENAAIWLRAAASAMSLSQDDKDLITDLSTSPAADWTAVQREQAEGLLTRNAPALLLVQRAAAMPRSSYLLETVRVHPDLPLLELIWLARTVNIRARLAAAEGDWAVLRSSVEGLACIGASLERESPLIAQLIGVASERMMDDALLAAVRSPASDRQALQGLEATIPDVDLAAAWRRALGYLGAGVHSGAIDLRDMFDEGTTRVAMSVPGPDEYLRIATEIQGLANRPMGLDDALVNRLEASKRHLQSRPPADILAGSLVRYQSLLSLRRLARLALRLRLAALERGSYPESLARWPESAAPDPLTGGALSYQRNPDGSATIAVPGAEELYNRINELKTVVPFAWELAPPTSR